MEWEPFRGLAVDEILAQLKTGHNKQGSLINQLNFQFDAIISFKATYFASQIYSKTVTMHLLSTCGNL